MTPAIVIRLARRWLAESESTTGRDEMALQLGAGRHHVATLLDLIEGLAQAIDPAAVEES